MVPELIERQAANLQPMPDGLSGSEQQLFLSLRTVYRDYRAGAINRDQAKREKAEVVKAYRLNAARDAVGENLMERLRRSELVRQEIERGGCELCRRLTRILDGRD
ncbi:hypothetical protein CE91St46_07520 [Eubacteriales bacterium]|nr:hypothetical protein [Faecalicatena sp. BF-R-105]GKH49641.1 hypothetical protein CE91St46_07520 [Eubacteriales bacterium]GKH62282.1 hypothetical protein CE91St47_07510 [Eubacteriales bacterium]